MTMGPVELDRKVRQLDNDVQSIYTMLSAIQGTQERHTNRLSELAVKVDGLEARFEGLEARFEGLDARFEGLDARFDGLDAKVDNLVSNMDTVLALLRETRE